MVALRAVGMCLGGEVVVELFTGRFRMIHRPKDVTHAFDKLASGVRKCGIPLSVHFVGSEVCS